MHKRSEGGTVARGLTSQGRVSAPVFATWSESSQVEGVDALRRRLWEAVRCAVLCFVLCDVCCALCAVCAVCCVLCAVERSLPRSSLP